MDNKIPVSAKNLAAFKELGGKIEFLEQDPNDNKYNVVVVTLTRHQTTEIQLWVRPHYSKYREAWKKRFGEASIPPGTDVDHIHSRERAAALGYEYVRLALVPAGANRSAGAGYEKALLNAYRTVHGDQGRPAGYDIPNIRYIDFVQETKIMSVKIGPKNGGYPGLFTHHNGLIAVNTLGKKWDKDKKNLPWTPMWH